MTKAVKDINWSYPGDAIPAFITIAIMPFTYSIAYGLIGGIMSYIFINTTVWLIEIASGGRIVPADKSLKDHWTWRIPGGFFPPWLQRVFRGKKDFWREDPKDTNGENPSQRDSSGSWDAHKIDIDNPPKEYVGSPPAEEIVQGEKVK
jgi:AGZA family xanthine/uracil permease-like MFS transporter